jgi:RNA polymerase sigma-70 factor, ECF subfamily
LTRYQTRLFGVCVRMIGSSPRSRQTASDLCQDAMVKVIAGLHSFDGSSKLSTWMIRVTMNVCLSHLRGQRLRNHASLEQTGAIGKSGGLDEFGDRDVFAKLMESREPASGSRVLRDEMRAKLVAGLATLEDSHRAVLILRDVQGLEYAQIGQVLDLPVGTVKSRLFRARLALRAAVDEAGKPAGEA